MAQDECRGSILSRCEAARRRHPGGHDRVSATGVFGGAEPRQQRWKNSSDKLTQARTQKRGAVPRAPVRSGVAMLLLVIDEAVETPRQDLPHAPTPAPTPRAREEIIQDQALDGRCVAENGAGDAAHPGEGVREAPRVRLPLTITANAYGQMHMWLRRSMDDATPRQSEGRPVRASSGASIGRPVPLLRNAQKRQERIERCGSLDGAARPSESQRKPHVVAA